MSVVKLGISQSLLNLPAVGQNPIIPARCRMSEPQYSSARPLMTLEQRLEFLDESIEDLKNRIADLVAENADEGEQLESAADLRIYQEARYEIVYLMRAVSRLRITGPQPCDYEDWIPWAYEQIRPRAPGETPEPEYEHRWTDWRRWAQSKRTLVRVPLRAPNIPFRAQKTERDPPVVRPTKGPPRKSPMRFWLLKIALRRFWLAISVTRSR